MSDIFGQGIAYPGAYTAAGRLKKSSGEDRVLETVEAILNTPLGTCPLDPLFGIDLDAYDPLSETAELAWEITRAIEYGEPRLENIEAVIERVDPGNGLVEIRVEVTPRGGITPLTRTFPFYRKE